MPAFIDLTGLTFGGLQVLERAPDGEVCGKATVRWQCRCACGTTTSFTGSALRNSGVKHCKPCADKLAGEKRRRDGTCGRIDMTGRIIGKLTVLRLGPPRRKDAMWICKCACGNEATVRAADLRNWHQQSCGRHCSLRPPPSPLTLRRMRSLARNMGRNWHEQAVFKRDAFQRPPPVRGARWLSVSASGAFALVDADLFERVNRYVWHLDRHGYPWAHEKGSKRFLRLHRIALGVGHGVHIDHKNRKPLDCRRKNLRVADKSKNGANAGKTRKGSTSRFKGVCRDNRKNWWRAYITVRGVRHELGIVQDEEEAARRYDDAARKHFKSFARLNFPRRGERSALD